MMGWEEKFGHDRYSYGIDCVTVPWVYTYLQTHQVVHIKFVQLFEYRQYLNKMVLGKKITKIS